MSSSSLKAQQPPLHHKLSVMPNMFLIYSRSLSSSAFKPQAFEISMLKSSMFTEIPGA